MTIPEDAAKRILEANVPDGSTTLAKVKQELQNSGDHRVTEKTARLVADAALTEEDVFREIEASGELPSDDELGAFVAAAEQNTVADEGRKRAVEQAVSDAVLTREEVEGSVQAANPVFREDVEQAVDNAVGRKTVLGGSTDDVKQELAEQAGAPREQDVNRVAAQAVAQSESVQVTETLSAETVTNVDGEPVAVVGRSDGAQEASEELGVPAVSPGDVDVGTRGSGRTVDVTIQGEKVGEVDVE